MRCCIALTDEDVVRKINLYDTPTYTEREITIWECPQCHTLKAWLDQYDKIAKEWKNDKPKNKKQTGKWIREYEKEPYIENVFNFKQGTWQNMQVHYQKNGSIVDFNQSITYSRYYKDIEKAMGYLTSRFSRTAQSKSV